MNVPALLFQDRCGAETEAAAQLSITKTSVDVEWQHRIRSSKNQQQQLQLGLPPTPPVYWGQQQPFGFCLGIAPACVGGGAGEALNDR